MTEVTIGLVSDTHGWLDPELVDVYRDHEVDHVIHAGDIGDEEVLEKLGELAPVHAVRGNIDGGDLRFLPEEQTLEVRGRTIGIRHISGNPREPKKSAVEFIRRENLDAIVVGHSHIPAVGEIEGALWLNPGAAGRHGFHTERLAAMLHVEESTGEFSLDRIELGARSE